MPKAKQLISFFQIFFAMPRQYSVTVPAEYERLTSWMKVFSLDLLDLYPASCVGDWEQQVQQPALAREQADSATNHWVIPAGRL